LKILIEATGQVRVQNEGKKVFIEGIGFRAGIKNRNSRIYEDRILQNSIERIMPQVREKSFMGTLSHENSSSVNLQNVSHIVESIVRKGSDWHVRSRLIEHGAGAVAKAILEAGGKCGYSSRGAGSTTKKNGVEYVNEDYQIFSLDLVNSPSTPGSMVALTECARSENLNDSMVARRLLETAAQASSVGNSLAAGYDRNRFDVGPYGYKWSDQGDFSRDGETFPNRMIADSNEIIQKLGALQAQPDWQAQDWQDAQSLKSYISQVADPYLRQKLYNMLSDAVAFQKMKDRASQLLGRIGKYNR
jgi:prohead core protein serine protease